MKNGVMIQYFEWNLPNDGELWKRLKEDAKHLSDIGVTSVWIPPAYKADAQQNEGYSTYDLFDLGEFDQKGTIRTKYGTKEELNEAINELHNHGISVYLDAVMNHKTGADYTEKFFVQEVDDYDRENTLSDPYEIEGWTGFNFDGRNNQYSDFKWHWYHFSGTGINHANGKTAVYKILGEGISWSHHVNNEFGNFDYLLDCDLDLNHPEVIAELNKWGTWVANELNLDGFRLDAIKHMDTDFIKQFLNTIRENKGDSFYLVGEYWKGDFDFTAFLNDTLVADFPENTVTFVDNHDSQGGCSLESQVESWFIPLAYGIILLMEKGYPCVFYGNYYGTGNETSPHRQIIDTLLDARRKYAYGEQHNYFDHPNTAGFTRGGDDEHPDSGLALLVSNGEDGEKQMFVGQQHTNEVWHEITGCIPDEVSIGEDGTALFKVCGGKLAVWAKKS